MRIFACFLVFVLDCDLEVQVSGRVHGSKAQSSHIHGFVTTAFQHPHFGLNAVVMELDILARNRLNAFPLWVGSHCVNNTGIEGTNDMDTFTKNGQSALSFQDSLVTMD